LDIYEANSNNNSTNNKYLINPANIFHILNITIAELKEEDMPMVLLV